MTGKACRSVGEGRVRGLASVVLSRHDSYTTQRLTRTWPEFATMYCSPLAAIKFSPLSPAPLTRAHSPSAPARAVDAEESAMRAFRYPFAVARSCSYAATDSRSCKWGGHAPQVSSPPRLEGQRRPVDVRLPL